MSLLRDVIESDLPVFFEHQRDPEATRMADFPARDRETFDAHWQRILADETGTLKTKTIVFEGQVAGNAVSWEQDGRRLVGYWLGQGVLGQGARDARPSPSSSTSSTTRPLYAYVAKTNVGSIRVLEKCGFVRSDEDDDLYELS